MRLGLAQLPPTQVSKTKGYRLTTGPTAICHKLGFFGGNEHFAALILKGYICVSALKTDSLVGGSLLGQLGLII